MSDDAINEADLFIVHACCCCNISFYPAIPDCIGCSAKTETCCALVACCCKCASPCLGCRAFKESAFLQCGLPCLAVGVKYPTTCVKTQAQLFCLTENCACPGDREIPQACTCFFLTCYPRCTCCLRLKYARTGYGGPPAPDAPPQCDDAPPRHARPPAPELMPRR